MTMAMFALSTVAIPSAEAAGPSIRFNTSTVDGLTWDSDGDGVPNFKDTCPTEEGPSSNEGCPASKGKPIPASKGRPIWNLDDPDADPDGDGVPNYKDTCPTWEGPNSNEGCPVSKPKPIVPSIQSVTSKEIISEIEDQESWIIKAYNPPTDQWGNGVTDQSNGKIQLSGKGSSDSNDASLTAELPWLFGKGSRYFNGQPIDLFFPLKEFTITYDFKVTCENNELVANTKSVSQNSGNGDIDNIVGLLTLPLSKGRCVDFAIDADGSIKISSSNTSDRKADWNNNGNNDPDKGDPLVFSMTDKQANVIRNWPEQHKSFLTEFDLFDNGENVTLSRTLDEGAMTLFLDLNGDGELSNGTEWLYDQNENVYQILSRPLIDSNQNGFFDYTDDLWSIAMVKDGKQYHSASELGIVGFNWSNAVKGYGDMHGDNRQYTDCLYEGKYFYPNCNAVSENHFAITAYNQNSILVNDGRVLDSFGIVMGYLDMSSTTKQTP